jgi:hypothetical protein
VLVRWFEDEQHDKLSDYMLASEARTLADEVVPELRYAGVRVPIDARHGAEYWQEFVALTRAALTALG